MLDLYMRTSNNTAKKTLYPDCVLTSFYFREKKIYFFPLQARKIRNEFKYDNGSMGKNEVWGNSEKKIAARR